MKCRHCKSPIKLNFVDLGNSPPSNAYLSAEDLKKVELYFPLRVNVCEECWLVQTEDFVDADRMFSSEYAYFSNFSEIWRTHCSNYAEEMINRFKLNSKSRFVEIASNDGCLLNFFHQKGIPSTGIEPTKSTAAVSKLKNHEVIEDFFTPEVAHKLASEGKKADLIAANNVLAHVPDVNTFIQAFVVLLKDDGVVTFEFPYLLNLIKGGQFDTIYHEHYSYLSLTSVKSILESNQLSIFDVHQVNTHGGSLRVFAQKTQVQKHAVKDVVSKMLLDEAEFGVNKADAYKHFQEKSNKVKNDFLGFLVDTYNSKKTVAAYGAAAKGNTLLNYSGIRSDLINFVVDLNPYKQNKYLPGSHIPIVGEEYLRLKRPDFIIIFPWNLKPEIVENLRYVRDWGCNFVTTIPNLEIF